MPRKPGKEKAGKERVVAFKVEPELAELLDKLPNKSAFIRKAIAAALGGVVCPLCTGEGIVPRGLNDLFVKIMHEKVARDCAGCGNTLEVPLDPSDLSDESKNRLRQFFFGGPLYCGDCFESAPECGDCGWHIDNEHFAEHHQEAHSE